MPNMFSPINEVTIRKVPLDFEETHDKLKYYNIHPTYVFRKKVFLEIKIELIKRTWPRQYFHRRNELRPAGKMMSSCLHWTVTKTSCSYPTQFEN